MEFKPGQTAVVTGAASGIGFGLASAFVDRGLSVVLADVEEERLNEVTTELSRRGSVLAVKADVSVADKVEEIRRAALERFGAIHVVCNNAGVNTRRLPMWEYELLDWQWVFGVNLWGVIHGIKTFVPGLIEQGYGHIVNTSSINGLITATNIGPYLITKHGIVALTECLAEELAEHAPEVRATVFCPRGVYTSIRHAERNRPDHLLSERGRAGELAPDFHEGSLSPAEAAEKVLEGIEQNVLHVIPSAGSWARIEPRLSRLMADLVKV